MVHYLLSSLTDKPPAPSADDIENTFTTLDAQMLTDAISLLIVILIGFALGYLVRDSKSRERRRRAREKYWYGK